MKSKENLLKTHFFYFKAFSMKTHSSSSFFFFFHFHRAMWEMTSKKFQRLYWLVPACNSETSIGELRIHFWNELYARTTDHSLRIMLHLLLKFRCVKSRHGSSQNCDFQEKLRMLADFQVLLHDNISISLSKFAVALCAAQAWCANTTRRGVRPVIMRRSRSKSVIKKNRHFEYL